MCVLNVKYLNYPILFLILFFWMFICLLYVFFSLSYRLKTIEILANFFRSVIVLSPDDFLHCVYLCLNRVAPEYEGIEMGVGETLLMKAVAQATGRTVDKIKAEVAIKGDLGLVSEVSLILMFFT